jgi:predicted ATP-dependent endonuclease of OLD family
MKLVSFHVRLFRNVIDSGEIEVDNVTCLVGKNEAGKSAIMQALHALNPAKPPFELDLLDEYPRWLKKEHEISGEIKISVPIVATFKLTADEMQAVEDRFGLQVLKSPTFRASRSYADAESLTVDADIDYTAFIESFMAAASERLKKAVAKQGEVGTSEALIRALKALGEKEGDENAQVAAIATDANEALARLWKITGHENRTLRTAVDNLLRKWMPRTFYFSSYAQLAGRYKIEDVFEAVQEGSDDEKIQAAADFLKIARAVPDTIEDWNYEQSNAELEAVSSLLTKRVREHWHQNDHLKLRVALESEKYTTHDGHERVHRYLQFRVEDTRHDFTSRLDRRSTGFQWFISFLAAFLEFEADKNLILLLDEPGLSLHARAQMDLLDAIESKLAAEREVIYSTHSPFMVRPNALGQARITEDRGPEEGTAIINDAGLVSDLDTLFPLEAALGYDIAQNLFIGRRNILLEGVSDYIYLTTMSGHLSQQGGKSLPTDARLIPAGGAGNIPTFLALLGVQLDAVVLIDGNTSQQKIDNTIAAGRLKQTHVVKLDQFVAVPGADIEDLFEPKEYLDLYNKTFGKSLKLTDLKGKDRIVKRIERKAGDFDHGVVAAYYLSNLADSLAGLSTDTLDRFEAVIEALTNALPLAAAVTP